MRDEAPFIWTSRQPINPMAMVAVFSPAEPRPEGLNRWFLFRRNFELSETVSSAPLNITVDGRYQLFVNGNRVGRGPARCSPLFQRYDTYNIAAHLRPGQNTVAVLVRVFGKDMSWYEQTVGLWQPVFGDGGLWVNGEISTPSETISLRTDLDWRCIESDAWLNDMPEANHGLGFIEVLDSNKLAENWAQPDYDDSDWDSVQIMQAGGGGPEAFFGGLTSKPFPHLIQNKLKPLGEDWIAPAKLIWVKEAIEQPDVPIHDQPYKEELVPLEAVSAQDVEACLSPDDEPCTVHTAPGRAVKLLFDFERLTTIHPVIEIEAQGGEIIDIVVNERLPDEWDENGLAADSRIGRAQLLGLDTHMARYIARPGVQRFERFEWQAAKWVEVTIRNAQQGLKIRRLGGVYTRYPAEARGAFTCSDPFLNQLWETGRYTLQLCMHDGWEDCPSREQRQWLGDATVENLVGHTAFGPDIAELNAEFLRKCAESQRPDGLTQMFAPGNHGTNGLLIPDWTLQWILNAGDHLRWTDDLEVIEEIFPSIQKALSWFERSQGPSGLVSNMAYWHFMDWSGVGRAGEACTLNAQLAGAYKAAAEMADALEARRLAQKYRDAATTLCEALRARHWDAERGVYVDVVDPSTGEQEKRVSQHANAAMILWGEAPVTQWSSMIDWITDRKRITFTAAPPIANTGEPLDEETGVVMANTFYSHFVFEALAKAGRLDLVFGFIRDRYGPMIERGATTLWESFGPTASLCHGFSASPTWQMSARILGVQRQHGGLLTFKPNLLDLDHAEGGLAIIEGEVNAQLARTQDGFEAKLDFPEGLEVEIYAPPGYRANAHKIGTADRHGLHVRYTRT